MAKNVSSWSGIVKMGAIDCASDENNGICRDFEIMRYPTMRYFGPRYPKGPKQLGTNLDHLLVPEIGELIDELTKHLVNETNGGAEWPQFNKFDGKSWNDIFESASLDTQYVYILNENLPELLSQQVLLDHVAVDNAAVRILVANSKLVQVNLFFSIFFCSR